MASGDFLELAQRACYQSRFRPENTDDLARAKEAVNECYLSVLNSGDRWSFLESEVQFTVDSSADTYNLSSISGVGPDIDLSRIYQFVNDTNGQPLEVLDWYSLENMSRSSQDSDPHGCPYAVAVFGGRFRVYPWPDKQYLIGLLYLAGDDGLSADADVPLIPYSWRHRIIVPYAAMRLWEQQSGNESLTHANYYRGQYEQYMQMFRERYASAQMPNIGMDSPMFSADLPGSVQFDHGFFDLAD